MSLLRKEVGKCDVERNKRTKANDYSQVVNLNQISYVMHLLINMHGSK